MQQHGIHLDLAENIMHLHNIPKFGILQASAGFARNLVTVIIPYNTSLTLVSKQNEIRRYSTFESVSDILGFNLMCAKCFMF